jgi:uncharacterized membrane protein (DUF485 family)
MKQRIAFALIMGSITTCFISFILISVNLGFGDKFLAAWLRGWGISYVLAVLAIIFIGPHVQSLVTKIVKDENAGKNS